MRRRRALAALPCWAWPAAAPGQPVVQWLALAGSRIELQFDEALPPALHADARAWVERAAQAVVAWLGRFPVQQLELLLQAVDGSGVVSGATFADPEPRVRIKLGRHTRAAQMADDWVLVHELLHLAVPRLAAAHNWLHEGIASYAEGPVRVLAGLRSAPDWWGWLARGLPQGQPAPGDAGLDFTPTWGRTYWGGALFCLQADVAMRRARLQHGLREALQGLQAAGGSYAVAWPVAQVLAAADTAVGGQVLAGLYARHRAQALPLDLAALWRDLGVDARQPLQAALDDSAPLADVRRAIAG